MNKWLGMGRLTRNPDVRYSDANGEQMAIARFTLAVDRRYAKGEAKADFISIVAFGKKAEFTERYLKQGTKVVVEGRIQTGSYTDKDGKKIYTTDVVAEELEFAESKKQEDSPTEQPPDEGFMDIPDNIDDLPFK